MFDASTRRVDSCKAQNEGKCGKVKRAKDIRAKMLRQLKEEIKKVHEVHVILVGHFNENACSKNTKKI